MIENLKPYDTYKESGVEWLGKVPEHWDVPRLKAVASIVMGQSPSSDDCNYDSIGLPFLQGCAEFGNRFPTPIQYCQTPAKTSPPGSLLLSVRAPVGKFNLSDQRYAIGRGLCAIVSSPNFPVQFTEFMLSTASSALLEVSTGSTYDAVSIGDVGNLRVIHPPQVEQHAITRFLDHVTKQIDQLIETNERMIELLKEMKQATIHDAVTGRIDVPTGKPYSKYKDSSEEWLGEIPTHWEVAPVKRYYHVQLGKMLQSQPTVNSDQEVNYLKARNIQWFNVGWNDLEAMYANKNELSKYGIKVGDLLVCEGGEGGRCAVATKNETRSQCIIQNALHRVRPRNLISPTNNHENEYLQYVLASVSSTGWFDVLCDKATIAHFTAEKFNRLNIPIPPFSERSTIARYLDHTTKQIEQAINARTKNINFLKEFRTALIADVVTGKIDVSDAARELRRVNNGI